MADRKVPVGGNMNASRQLSLIAAIVLSFSAGCGGGGSDNPPPPPAVSCTDGIKNGTETGIDCGGTTCVAQGRTCAVGALCGGSADCASGFCNPTTNLCAAPSCTDGFTNGGEPGLDCGGPCLPGTKCVDGLGCDTDVDCVNGYCNASKVCGTPTCTDGAKNGFETGVDCGGATCVADGKKCSDGVSCVAAVDCVSGYCNGSSLCATPTCTDGAKNGLETGLDCGGTTCVALGKTCPTNGTCIIAADCTSGVCDAGGVCQLPPCANGVKDGTETDVDCGGPQCTFEGKTCADTRACTVATDCASSYCAPTNVCATPTCADAWVNGNETGLNCGGGTCPDCANGLGCAVDGDCTSGFCNASTHLCAAPTCSDGWKNGAETDVDCGASCPTKCPEGFDCAQTTDCAAALVCDPTTHVCAQACAANAVPCADNLDCCTGYCDKSVPGSFVCADPVLCTANGEGCAFNATCCTGYCDPSKLCGTPPTCRDLAVACSANADCCDQYCNPSTRLCDVPVSTCEATGSACAAGGECCSKACSTTTNACTSTAFCKVAGAACVNSGECCSVSCVAGVCSDTLCEPTGSACTSGAECCTGTCTSNLCASIPAPSGTSACTTLGDACDPAADTCCSKNCQGGMCTPAFTCHAPSDLCFRNEDCCSGKCTSTSPTVAGRCLAPTGGDVQGGAPCDGPTTCVTRLCVDLGSGQTVCKPAGGCRMTGDYCNPNEYSTTTACTSGNYKTVCWPLYGDNSTCSAGFCTNPNGVCCGGTPDKVDPAGYGVECAPKQVGAPTICSNGQSCNPPGNICGAAGDNASQNCCAGQKAVCKRDLNGIARCFGGGSTTCPTGYDGSNPACCIGTDPGTSGFDNVCQFRDQCCNFVPCVPDESGVLRCTQPPSCAPLHASCSGPDDGSCCAGTVCTGSGTFTCEVPSSCEVNGATCTVNSDCCGNNCSNPTGTAGGGVCAPPCASTGATCTFNGDCCSGLSCNIPPGATSGSCESVSSCAPTNGGCTLDSDCCNNALTPPFQEVCDEGRCAVPLTCIPQFGACDSVTAASCCSAGNLTCMEQDGTACLAGSTTCSCDTCSESGGACDPSAADTGCCTGLQCFGTGSVGTCGSCLIGGDACTATSECCPGVPGNPVFCADTTTGESCAGGSCTCATCQLNGSACSTNDANCCGDWTFCAAADGVSSCGPDDLDCLCIFTGG